MRFLVTLFTLSTLIFPALLHASSEVPAVPSSSTIELLLERAISQNLIAGGVVVVGNHQGIISATSRGHLSPEEGAPALDERTVFDVASLTKVIATAPAVMKLVDEGRINLTDPLSRWFPEFAGSEITIQHLLTHTSGLHDVTVSPEQSMQSAIRKAAAQREHPGGRFQYADINFILLGEVVQRVSGETLAAFCREQIYTPLGAKETMFLPPHDPGFYIAPTSGYTAGVVQDPNARRLGGVAGHAGLFSSAYDLSRYARLILGGGVLDDRRILSEQVVAQMTSPHLCNDGRVIRGLGWDIDSPYSAPKGSFFSDASFGHTGYSGSSIWIDPKQDLFVIMLTRRINYTDTRSFNNLRRHVSTIAVADLKLPGYDPGQVLEPQEAKSSAVPRRVAAAKRSSSRGKQLVAQAEPKLKLKQRGRHSDRAERVLARAGAGRRAIHLARVSRIAKAATCKTPAKKKRHLRDG